MKNGIFLFTGFILIATGVICFFALNASTLKINGTIVHDLATKNLVRYFVSGGLGGLGAIFALVGLIGRSRSSQQLKRNQYILQNGVDAVGTVTFVDKNYTLLVNNNPIYSYLEYTYQDKAGNQHKRKIDNLSSELVIRNQIQVGVQINIKYLAENPGESVIIVS